MLGLSSSHLTLSYGPNLRDGHRSVVVQLVESDVLPVVWSMLTRTHAGKAGGLLHCILTEAGDGGGEELPVPTVSEAALAAMSMATVARH